MQPAALIGLAALVGAQATSSTTWENVTSTTWTTTTWFCSPQSLLVSFKQTMMLPMPMFSWEDMAFLLSLANSTTTKPWLGQEEGLSLERGCNSHPGLSKNMMYCANTFLISIFENHPMKDWSIVDWDEWIPAACLAYNLPEQVLSLAFDPPIRLVFYAPFKLGVSFAGATFGNAKVALLDYIDPEMQLRTGEELPVHVTVAAGMEIGLGIPKILQAALSIEGVWGMNLDVRQGGTMLSPGHVLQTVAMSPETIPAQNALLKAGHDLVGASADFAVVVQAQIQFQVMVLFLTIKLPPSLRVQYMVKSGPSGFTFSVTAILNHLTRLSDILEGMEFLEDICGVKFLPDSVRNSPLCWEPSHRMYDENASMISLVIAGEAVAVEIRAWGMWLGIRAAADGMRLCRDGACSEAAACAHDGMCGPGFHCCVSTLEFTCQKFYKNKLTGDRIPCIALETQKELGLAVDPADGKGEGEDCDLDSDCGIDMHCCHTTFDLKCRKVEYNKITGWPCSCLIAETDLCVEPTSKAKEGGWLMASFLLISAWL
ncbi:unnamed protein product [Effrenium voratum]|nr:unnamed protein product [Effrenium voratum]